jgi:hypothetical protein
MFKFKQFNVDQTGCAMKINIDGVLLGAFAEVDYSLVIASAARQSRTLHTCDCFIVPLRNDIVLYRFA